MEIRIPQDEGLIASDSRVALVISWGAVVLLAGLFGAGAIIALFDADWDAGWQDSLIVVALGVVIVPIAGTGIYHLLVML